MVTKERAEPKNFDGHYSHKQVQATGPNYEAQHLAEMTDRDVAKGKIQVYDINKDSEIIARVRNTMRPNEALGAWYARTGLRKSQILAMSEDEIIRHIEICLPDDSYGEPTGECHLVPIEIPKKFLL
jgi:hypothetical protein